MRYPIDLLKSHPPGRVEKVRVADFADGVATVDFPSGTGVISDPATTAGFAGATTAATIDATASLRSKWPVSLASIEAIRVDVEGFTFSDHNIVADFMVGIRTVGGTPGVYAIQRATEAGMKLGNSGTSAASETVTNLNLRGGIQAGNSVPRNFSLLLQCRTKEMFLLAEGSLVGYRDVSATLALATNVRPSLELTVKEAAAKSFRVKQFRQTVWVN